MPLGLFFATTCHLWAYFVYKKTTKENGVCMGAIQYHTVEVTAGGDLFSITFLQTCAESGTAGLCSPGSAPVLVIILFLTNNKIVSSTDYCVIQYVLGFFSMLTFRRYCVFCACRGYRATDNYNRAPDLA